MVERPSRDSIHHSLISIGIVCMFLYEQFVFLSCDDLILSQEENFYYYI